MARVKENFRESVSLYVHVPFCKSRCAYCNFYSGEDPALTARYLKAVPLEAALEKASLPNRFSASLYFGGGTPSLLGAEALVKLKESILEHFPPLDGMEVTAEANPNSPLDLALLKKSGFTRLSVGVQALSEKCLNTLGRSHTPGEALDFLKAGVESGLEVSADLMYGYRGLAADELCGFARKLAEAGVAHLSAYSLEMGGKVKAACAKAEEAQANALDAALLSLGFLQYEVSNWALPGHESRHNRSYWEGKAWLGLGPGAHSYFPESGLHGERRWNLPSLPAYLESLESGNPPPRQSEFPDREEALLERLFLAFRNTRPFPAARLSASPALLPLLSALCREGDLEKLEGGFFRMTRQGLLRADGLAGWVKARLT